MEYSNILQLPFRRTHTLDLGTAIKQYISTKYDQHPDTFADDLRLIDQLRSDAINVQEPHVSGLKKLQAYAAQLRWIGGKFPIDVGVNFAWYPALGFHTHEAVIQNNLRFELANILFNLASLYSQLAFAGNRTTPEGLKTAAQYGMSAAGTLAFLRTEVIPDMRSTPPEDMDDMTLQSLENLCLAQAQECFWQKSVKDNMRDGTIARLAAKVSDYYSEAGDYAVKSDAISTEWIHHITAKHHHFAAAAQYRQSRDCLEKRKYGEEVARLKDSIACINEALKESRWINRIVKGDLEGLRSRVTEDLKRAERDNDVIYMLPVPPKTELKLLDRANMVSPKPPKEVADGTTMLGPGGEFGQPLFARLVPYAVHQAASIYSDRRDRLVNQSIISDFEAMTARLRDLIQSLNLPGSLQALEKPLGLPASLVSKADELRQQDAHYRLRRAMDDTAKLKDNDMSLFKEGNNFLASEKSEDDRARGKFGTDRWNRQPSELALSKLYAQSKELQGYLNSAASSDELVRTKMRENEPIIRVLTGSTRELESYVPSSRHINMDPAIERASTNLRTALNGASRLESARRRKIETLREKARSDDINPALLAETARLEREFPMQKIEAAQFETLFDSRLETYERDREALSTEQEEQDQVVARLRESNKAFVEARRGDSSTREREKALQELETGYVKYKEIVSNLETGRKFYNDLAAHVSRFRDSAADAISQRRLEAQHLEAELGMERLQLGDQASQLRREKENAVSHVPAAVHHKPPPPIVFGQQPLAAPVPIASAGAGGRMPGGLPPSSQGVWTPDMGIRFGGTGGVGVGYPGPKRA